MCTLNVTDPNGNRCTGTGTGSVASHWPGCYLQIKYAENLYGATLDSSVLSATFPDTLTCPDGQAHGNLRYDSMQTYRPPRGTYVGAVKLSGTGNLSVPNATATYAWQFDADVP